VSELFAGLDGGGTKTQAVIVDRGGREIARATSGPSNYHSVGQAATHASLHAAIGQVLVQAGAKPDDLAAIGLGMAGVARLQDVQVMRALLAQVAPTTCLAITHDAETALVGGIGRRYGAILIAGTGAIAYGINAGGETQRADGWGYLLGDDGSGYWIGRQALRATARACDGRSSKTTLANQILVALGLHACDELVERVYGRDLSVPEIAALAPVVLAAALREDRVARGILCQAGAQLGHTLCTVLRRLNMGAQAFEIVLLGGVLSAESLVRETVVAALEDFAPAAKVIEPRNSAAFGAALLARDLWAKQKETAYE
jgi:N-acetylglucosamine kinase-like BadF-type ATPase